MPDEPKTCPFCGGSPTEFHEAGGWCYIRCEKCKARGPPEHLGHNGDWVKAWNTRVDNANG